MNIKFEGLSILNAFLLCFLPDDGTFLEHTPPPSSGGEGGGGEVTPAPSAHISAPHLAPSLTPASQPTISLLTDSSADTLSVESLTLLPPTDMPHLHPIASLISATLPLQRLDASIAEEEEEENDGGGKGEQQEKEEEEEGSPLDETETDATIKEETTTTELVTPTDEAPEEEAAGEENTEQVSTTEGEESTERHTETPESPELD